MKPNTHIMNAKRGSIKSLLRDSVFLMSDAPRSNQKGFTLMETLVAIAILLVAVVGPISLIGDALHKLYYARDEMIAINLAQEGIEAVRQVRDSNKLAGVGWTTGLAVSDYTVDVGQLSASQSVLSVCGAPLSCAPQPVYFDTPTGLYRQGTGSTLTQFSRVVTINNVSPVVPYERSVTSVVTWATAGQAGSITVTENIFDWQI